LQSGPNYRAQRGPVQREEFQFFWTYRAPVWAGRFLDRWCTKTLRSRIEPMQQVARMLRAHRPLLLNWFRAKGALSSAAVEGFNNKAKLTTRTAFGFRTYRAMEIALYHTLGASPGPESPHRFFRGGNNRYRFMVARGRLCSSIRRESCP
jgi:transposase